MGDELTVSEMVTNQYGAVCKYCGRSEEFSGEASAWAWLTEHIRVEHGGRLPAFEGVPEGE